MEHIFFEAQLCSEIAVFKEKHVFDILIILCLMTSLRIVFHPFFEPISACLIILHAFVIGAYVQAGP